MFTIDVLTLFPEVFAPFVGLSIVGRAVEAGIVEVAVEDVPAVGGEGVGHIALLGRQKPLQRVGRLMLRTFDRLRRLELANGTMCPFPLQRQHLADAAGMSMIHLNRTLAQLRDERLAAIEDKMLIIHDRRRLADLSGYASLRLIPQRVLL